MRKAEGRNLESRYEKAIMGEPAPARSVTAGRSGPRAGNGSRATPEGIRDGTGMPVGRWARQGDIHNKKIVYF